MSLQFIVLIILSYYYDLSAGLIAAAVMNTVFTNNYRTISILLINTLVYTIYGKETLIIAKLYVVVLGLSIFGNKFFALPKIISNNLVLNRIHKYYDDINYFFTLASYLVYDNLMFLFDELGMSKYGFTFPLLKQYNDIEKMKKQMKKQMKGQIDSMFKMPTMNEIDIDNNNDIMDDMPDFEFFDMKNILEFGNNLRSTIGKEELTEDDLNKKIEQFAPMFNIFQESFSKNMRPESEIINEDVD